MSDTERRRAALRLAAATDTDPRTADRALRLGLEAVKSHADRERMTTAARELGIALPTAAVDAASRTPK